MSDLIRIRVQRNKNFTSINLTAVEDPNLSWGAKGLHLYLMSRPDDWDIRFKDLLNRASDKDSSLKNKVKELRVNGYLKIDKVSARKRKQGGKFGGSTWTAYEEPQEELITVRRKTATRSKPASIQDSHRMAENRQTEKPSDGKSTHLIDNTPNNQSVQEIEPHTGECACPTSFELTLFKEIAGYIPEDPEIQKQIEECVKRTTEKKMRKALKQWKWKNYRLENLDWLSDWAINGIPKHKRNGSASQQEDLMFHSVESVEVMDYFNRKYQKNFTSLSNHGLINALIQSGYTLDQIKTTIDHRYGELEEEYYADPDISKWFKPQIIFRLENFEGYFNSCYTTNWKT